LFFSGVNFAEIQARMGQYPDAPPVHRVVRHEVVGIAALQMCKWRRGVDIVLDTQGGQSFRKSLRCLASLGRFLMFGVGDLVVRRTRSLSAVINGAIQFPFVHSLSLLNSNRGVMGHSMGRLFREAGRTYGDMEEIIRLVDDGTFAPVVDQVSTFEQAPAAHHYRRDRRNFGKVLLKP
jgi:NADPH:quinone reductase-like Zn-dependent oxidoreductase